MEKGSALILAIIAVLLLSMIVISGLSVSSTEMVTTNNYFMNKAAYYKAVEGVETIAEQIREVLDDTTIIAEKADYVTQGDNLTKSFITGSMVDFQNNTPQYIQPFAGFDPPPLPSISLGATSNISAVVWFVPITAEVIQGRKRSYAEIEAGIYDILVTQQ